MSRVFLTVLDAVGAGEAPDAAEYGDAGSNTLGHVIEACHPSLPNMAAMGLGNIETTGYEWNGPVAGAGGRALETSKGKDTTSGHWEIAGVRVTQAFPTFPDGFPREFMEAYEKAIGYKCIGNKPASGTAIIEELGEAHLRDHTPIVYTSGDSVFQIACHEELFPPESCMNSAGPRGKCCKATWASAGLLPVRLSGNPEASSARETGGISPCRPAGVPCRRRSWKPGWNPSASARSRTSSPMRA